MTTVPDGQTADSYLEAICREAMKRKYSPFEPQLWVDAHARLQEELTPFRYVLETYFHESFGHLEGYSAIYYTYMWSLVIAKDLFSVFRREGLMDPAAAARYRRSVLEPGGSAKAAELVRDFLGRDYDFAAFEEWLSAG